jgi:ectoine hydroxylase-related dioxygenase (phytanoyl-CoA dioxygenase family)
MRPILQHHNMCSCVLPLWLQVLFWDDLWHCSGPNSSNYTRSAYMAQFSSQPLVWQDSGGLVGLAVHLSALW